MKGKKGIVDDLRQQHGRDSAKRYTILRKVRRKHPYCLDDRIILNVNIGNKLLIDLPNTATNFFNEGWDGNVFSKQSLSLFGVTPLIRGDDDRLSF